MDKYNDRTAYFVWEYQFIWFSGAIKLCSSRPKLFLRNYPCFQAINRTVNMSPWTLVSVKMVSNTLLKQYSSIPQKCPLKIFIRHLNWNPFKSQKGDRQNRGVQEDSKVIYYKRGNMYLAYWNGGGVDLTDAFIALHFFLNINFIPGDRHFN